MSINPDRAKLVEYKRFANLKFEIQIRSILQHTWAEIEHDIGYKSKVEIPKGIRRQFSRLAGLLELADNEFKSIRESLEDYEKEVEKNIDTYPENIDIDAVSILELLNNNKIIKELNEQVARTANFGSIENIDKERANHHIEYISYFGIKTISELLDEFHNNKDLIILRAKDIDADGDKTNKGIAAFYLYQVLASKLGDTGKIMKFLNDMNLAKLDEREEFCKYLEDLNSKLTQ